MRSHLPSLLFLRASASSDFHRYALDGGDYHDQSVCHWNAAAAGPTFSVHGLTFRARISCDTGRPRCGDVLASSTPVCHAARLDKPEHLGQVRVAGTKTLFLNNSPFGHLAKVDLTRPAPPVQQNLGPIEQFDQRQARDFTRQPAPAQNQRYAPHR